jgi:hypothetical protein
VFAISGFLFPTKQLKKNKPNKPKTQEPPTHNNPTKQKNSPHHNTHHQPTNRTKHKIPHTKTPKADPAKTPAPPLLVCDRKKYLK